jgi:hypothetical protein
MDLLPAGKDKGSKNNDNKYFIHCTPTVLFFDGLGSDTWLTCLAGPKNTNAPLRLFQPDRFLFKPDIHLCFPVRALVDLYAAVICHLLIPFLYHFL